MGVEKNNFIPLSVPTIKGNEWKYVKECLDTEWVSSVGQYVDRFEKDICQFTGSKYAVACVNGTSALHIALQLAGVKPGDEVIVPTVTFIAPVNTIRYLGAEPVFMDCDDFFNIDIEKTEEFIKQETEYKEGLTINKTTGSTIRAIVPVHMFGNAVNMERILPVCNERNIMIVEDATESLGTYYIEGSIKNKHTGTIGQLGCYSFNGNKIITTGGGGMIVTDDIGHAKKAKYLTTQAKDDEVRFVHNEVGYNYRLTNIQAALGVAQLERLSDFINIKKDNYNLYKKNIDTIQGLHLAEVPGYANNNHWMYPLFVEKVEYGMDREGLMQHLSNNGIQTRPLWYLNHLQKPYIKSQGYKIEKAYELLAKTLNIPCSTNLTERDILKVVRVLKQ
jgi:aminotransferase in exopolysaccharide biosynthesis